MMATHTGHSDIADTVGRNSTQYDAKRLTIGRPISSIAGNTPAMPLNDAHFGGFFMPEIYSVAMSWRFQ
jgi:hypothetical protein